MTTDFQKTIIVTGASSGIGKITALYLARHGYTVLATVRKASGAEMLNSYGIPTLHPIFPVDLTNQQEIDIACETILRRFENKELPPLHALLFIAGGGQIAPIELMNIEKYRNELEVRLVSTVSFVQKFCPLLRQTRGRIIWIATPALIPVPYVADIHCADYAVNYLARTLNVELQPDGIKNILIRCGGIDTPSPGRTEKNIVGQLGNIPEEKINIYKSRLEKLEDSLKRFAQKRTDPEAVAKTIEKALQSERPKIRYQVGHLSRTAAFLEKFPQSWIDVLMRKRER